MSHSFVTMVGLPGQGMRFGIDPLSALFLVLLLPMVLAGALTGVARSGAFIACGLAMVLTIAAQDVFALLFGFGLMGAAAAASLLPDRWRAAAGISFALAANACLIPAVFLPPGSAGFVLILLAAFLQAAPAIASAAAPGRAGWRSAFLSGGIAVVSVYLVVRFGLVEMRAAAAPWWGVLVIAIGAAAGLAGAARAMLDTAIKSLLTGAMVSQLGLVLTGIGLALGAASIPNPALATLAAQAALLSLAAQALFMPLLFLGAYVIEDATGSVSLDWLGGLMRGMPLLGLAMLAGVWGMAMLPVGPGFAPFLLLVHAVIAAAGAGGIVSRIGCVALLAAIGLSMGLALGAAVRLIGIGFLGRPRTLRAAAAEEAPRRMLVAMALLIAGMLPVALSPGLVLAAIRPAIAVLVPGMAPIRLGYAPLPVVALMAAFGAAAFLVLRRFGARGAREAPNWNGGFGKPPAWLPFGDPATQPTATGFAQPAAQALEAACAGWAATQVFMRRFARKLARTAPRPRWPAGGAPGLATAMVILLAILAALGWDGRG